MSAIYSDRIEGAAFITRAVMREVEEAVERARVVGVLDAFDPLWCMGKLSGRPAVVLTVKTAKPHRKVESTRWFAGNTPDAARAAAAKAIEAGEV